MRLSETPIFFKMQMILFFKKLLFGFKKKSISRLPFLGESALLHSLGFWETDNWGALSSPLLGCPHDTGWIKQTLLGTQKEVNEVNSFEVSSWRTCLCIPTTMIPRASVILSFHRPYYLSILSSKEKLQRSPDNSLSLSLDFLS